MRTILILLLIILHTQIQAQTTRIENDLFVKVVTKFKKDKESFEEFKYLGLCHCINSVLENEEDLFFAEYIDYYNNKRIQSKTKWMPPVNYRITSICLN